jgi:uncharacterized cupin superfamily protein
MRMILEPGETFEHAHQGESITTLLEGEVDLIADDTRTSLVIGVPTPLVPNMSHILVNVGEHIAVLKCAHVIGALPDS